ncbi:hypothetical protein BDV93DRAFT_562779 [Ceratobasidium sp. AG-I]|nr:hypothetical protein BDV93DRAFT_562779 [Ceratobasidium sp. AG-I]
MRIVILALIVPLGVAHAQEDTSSTYTPTSSAVSTTPTILPGWGGQCGGIGYTGPTTCASPYTCHLVNKYASQCY